MKSHHRGRSPHSLSPPGWRLSDVTSLVRVRLSWCSLGLFSFLPISAPDSRTSLPSPSHYCPSKCSAQRQPPLILEVPLPPPTCHEPHLSQHEGFIGTVFHWMTFMDVVTRTVAQGLLRSRVQPEPWPLYLLLSFMPTPQFHEWETEAQRLVQGQAQNCHPFHSPFRDAVYFC